MFELDCGFDDDWFRNAEQWTLPPGSYCFKSEVSASSHLICTQMNTPREHCATVATSLETQERN
jgi:hypothetical protein